MAYEELPEESSMPAIFHDWLSDLEDIEERSARTVKAYSQALRRVLHFAELQPEALTDPANLSQSVLTNAVREMRRAARRVSKSTLNQTLAALMSFFDWCVITKDSEDKPILKGDPPDIRRLRKVTKLESPSTRPEYYLPADIADLYTAARQSSPTASEVRWPARDLAMCGVLTVLGLRASELTGLRVNSITQERLSDSEDSATWILQVHGKGNKWRSLPLSLELYEAIENWQEVRRVEIESLQMKVRDLKPLVGLVDWLVDATGIPTSVIDHAVRSTMLFVIATELMGGNPVLGEGDLTSSENFESLKRSAQEEASKTLLFVVPAVLMGNRGDADRLLGRSVNASVVAAVLMGNRRDADRLLEGSVNTLDNETKEHAGRAERLAPEPEAPLFVPKSGWTKVDTEGKTGGDSELRGFSYRQLRYWMLSLNKAAGLRERTPHALRHTAGVQLAADGVPMNVIQGLLGHASIATTGIYTELAAGELLGALKRSEANSLLGIALDETT